MKKLFLSLLFIPALLTGCGENSTPTPVAEHCINVGINEVTLYEGDDFQIPIEVIKPAIIICRSNNEEIATVNHEGLINAISEGETSISISGGADRYLIFVTVLKETSKSSLSIDMPKNEFTLEVGDEYELPLKVKYGLEEIKEPRLSYEYEIADIISITNYTISTLNVGYTKVVVTASYDDLEISEIFTVTVYQ